MKNLTRIIDRYEYPPEVTTREWLGSDYYYRTLVTTADDAEKFNYHSDYWGDAYEYQEENFDLMLDLESYVGDRCYVDYGGDDYIEGTLEGILIDNQYNSISHTCILLSDVTNERGDKSARRSFRRMRIRSRIASPSKYDCIGLYRPSDAPDDAIADIMMYWFDCAKSYGDRGGCVIGAGFTFRYQGKWYFMHSQSPWQGSLSWEHFVNDIEDELQLVGADEIRYHWGSLD